MYNKKGKSTSYKWRTEEGIRKLKIRQNAKIGNPEDLKRRRELHRKDGRISLRGGALQRSKKNNIPFNIPTYKDLPKVPKYCPILRIPLIIGRGVSTDNSPTLDRIDNNKGYIKGNIHIISRKANQMKSNANLKEIEMLYDYMKAILI